MSDHIRSVSTYPYSTVLLFHRESKKIIVYMETLPSACSDCESNFDTWRMKFTLRNTIEIYNFPT